MQLIVNEIETENNTEQVSDEELMLRFSDGETEAFTILYHRHKQTIYSFIRLYLKSIDSIDDVFQSIFLRIIKYRGRYQPKAKFTTWLYMITRSVCIDTIRKNKHADVIQLFPDNIDEVSCHELHPNSNPNECPREMVFHAELQSSIESIIHSLPQEQREVLLLREKTDMTFKEIGKLIGCSTNTVKSRMHYALLALRKGLEERGFSYK